MRHHRQSYGRLVGAITLATAVCGLIGACTGKSSTQQAARAVEDGWGAGDAVGRQLFDTKTRAARGKPSISTTYANAERSNSDQ